MPVRHFTQKTQYESAWLVPTHQEDGMSAVLGLQWLSAMGFA